MKNFFAPEIGTLKNHAPCARQKHIFFNFVGKILNISEKVYNFVPILT